MASVVKNLPVDAGDERDLGSVPGSEISSVIGNANPLPYSCLENSMGREPGGRPSRGSQRITHRRKGIHLATCEY